MTEVNFYNTPTGFDPQTIQPVVSHHNDYTIPTLQNSHIAFTSIRVVQQTIYITRHGKLTTLHPLHTVEKFLSILVLQLTQNYFNDCINNYENKVTEEGDTINVSHHWHHAYTKVIEHFSTGIQDTPAITELTSNITALNGTHSYILYIVRGFQLVELMPLHSNQVISIKMH